MRGVLGLHCVKRLSTTLQKGRCVRVCVRGGMRLVFLQRENQTNWIWSIAVPLGRACCLQRQCDTAYPRRRHNKMLIRQQQGQGEKKLHFELTFANCEKKKNLIYSVYVSISVSLRIYQFIRPDAAFLWSVMLMAAAKHCTHSAKYLSIWKKSNKNRQTGAGRQTDRQMDAQAEPLCAVVLTTEQEQHPGLRVWMGNERHKKGCTKKKKKKTCKPH